MTFETDEQKMELGESIFGNDAHNPAPAISSVSRKVIPLTRERFLSGGKPKSMIVEMPEFVDPETGEIPSVRVMGMTGGQQDQVSQMTTTTYDPDSKKMVLNTEPIRARVLAWCVLDPITNQPLFSLEDVFVLNAMGNHVVSRLYSYIQELSAVPQAEVDKIAALFPKTPAGNSSTT